MHSISPKQYRVACVAALICLALRFAPTWGLIHFDKGVAAALSWRHFGAIMPYWGRRLFGIVWFGLTVVALLGMPRFWRPSRWCFALALLADLLAMPVYGLLVNSAYEATVASLFGCVSLWLVTLSFWSPLAEKFSSERPLAVT
jgi:hypothetical protein